jgi:UDP-2,3-diacylglucosamine hydrolase
MKQVNLNTFDLFISDLHLCASRPHITHSFVQFLKNIASSARALYILGDLFEYWAGDDDISHADHHAIILALKALRESGTALYIMHGNRDFLIGDAFCKAIGATLLNDPVLLNLYGKQVLLSHGDDLCIDDVAYMQFKVRVRNPAWVQDFLSQPLSMRKVYIESVRMRSELEKKEKSVEIMDVNPEAVDALLKKYALPDYFIHGHTHRPNVHTLVVNDKEIKRYVLGDWYEQGSFLKLSDVGIENVYLTY